MADRYLWNVQSPVRSLVVLPIELTITGHATPASGTFAVVKGKECTSGATFARATTGEYTLTLKDKWPSYVSASIEVYAHGGAARQARIKSIVAATGVVTFQILTEALVAGDTPADEVDRVRLILCFKNTSVDR